MNVETTFYCGNEGCWYRYYIKDDNRYTKGGKWYKCPTCGHRIFIKNPQLEGEG